MKRLLRTSLSTVILAIALLNQSFAQCSSGSTTTLSGGDLDVVFKGASTVDGQTTLTFRVVNTNKTGNFEYAAFELPKGAAAVSPREAVQLVPSQTVGTKIMYSVENPSKSPESTIKYSITSAHGTFKSQGYDEFQYVMSAYEFSQMESLTVTVKHAKITNPAKITFPLRNSSNAPLLACQPVNPSFTTTGIQGPIDPMAGTLVTYYIESPTALSYKWDIPTGWEYNGPKTGSSIIVKVGEGAGAVTVDMEQPNNAASLVRTLAVSPAPNPLPVELVNFAGIARTESVDLNWSTATEINNEKFEIERSVNGKDFVKIGTVKGAGNSNVLRQYRYIDSQPLSGISYYRLKQVDIDQAYEYSKVIAVKGVQSNSNLEADLFPNPVTEKHILVRLKNHGQNNTPVTFVITDLTGKTVMTKALNPSLQEERVELPIQALKQGMYMVSISSGDATSQQRIVIQ
ncbi:T9SS type A sorting domain-containing protein [Rufibacter sp. DG15C]|uniref:T9SS type A sorting domain-containing protein n=1 Tax=Rufibacter sp. DG15C TaxID=1379909 RepID=UPI0009ECB4CC|nr:T9SS type A sorting domain-containing protein [Rufibacter sp. DG15C]